MLFVFACLSCLLLIVGLFVGCWGVGNCVNSVGLDFLLMLCICFIVCLLVLLAAFLLLVVLFGCCGFGVAILLVLVVVRT